MSRFGSPSDERLESYANGIELQKYQDEDEGEREAGREREGLLGADSSFRTSNGSRRRISRAQCSCIIILSLLILVFAVFGLRRYLPTSSVELVEDHCACGTEPYGAALCSSYSAPALERSRLFTGTGARTRKFLDVARKRPVKVGILGGSVSACHGVDTDSMGRSCYARRIVDWMRERLYAGNADGVVAVNGAIGGMDSR